MAVTYAVLSGNVTDMIGTDDPEVIKRTKLWVENNSTDGVLLDTADNKLMVGAKRIDIDPNTGAFAQALVETDSADVLPATQRRYRVHGEYPDGTPRAQRKGMKSGWFTLTADATLVAKVAESIDVINVDPDLAGSVAANAALVLGVIATTDGLVENVVESAVSLTAAALAAALADQTHPLNIALAAEATLTGGVIYAVRNGVDESNSRSTNTTALNALHTAALAIGATIVLPAGTFDLNALTIKVPMKGAGLGTTTLDLTATITLGEDSASLNDLSVFTSNATAITAANKTKFSLERVDFEWAGSVSTAWLGLDAFNIDRLRVLGCQFHIGGVQLSGCDDFLIGGNWWDCEYTNTNEPCHISASSSGHFDNNTVLNTLTDALDLFSSGENCVVSNNRFIGLRGASGMEVKVQMSDNPANTSSAGNVIDGVVITGNILRDFNPPSGSATRVGIYAEYVDVRSSPAFDITETNRALVITDNVLEDFNLTTHGSTVNYWGIAYTGHNGIIHDNVVRNMRQQNGSNNVGIHLSQPTGSKCIGVDVHDNILAGVEGGAGIQSGNLDECQVHHNTVRRDDVSGRETKYGYNAIAGATINDSSISHNTFSCNNATGMGLRAASSTVTFNTVDFIGNKMKNCGVSLACSVQDCSFDGGSLDNATNSQNFAVGVSGTPSRGNSYTGIKIKMSSDYGLVLTDHDGFFVGAGMTYRNTNRGLLLVGNTKNGIVDGNISITQSGGSEMPHYSGVSAPDQATITVGSNKVL